MGTKATNGSTKRPRWQGSEDSELKRRCSWSSLFLEQNIDGTGGSVVNPSCRGNRWNFITYSFLDIPWSMVETSFLASPNHHDIMFFWAPSEITRPLNQLVSPEGLIKSHHPRRLGQGRPRNWTAMDRTRRKKDNDNSSSSWAQQWPFLDGSHGQPLSDEILKENHWAKMKW